jgi:hypothetical protein
MKGSNFQINEKKMRKKNGCLIKGDVVSFITMDIIVGIDLILMVEG